MAGNTLGDLLKAGQLDLLKQVSVGSKAASKQSMTTTVGKSKAALLSTSVSGKSKIPDDYTVFHSYVRAVVQKSELYETMFDYGEEESFATIAELYDSQVCKDIIDYFACRFFDGEYDYLDSLATDCEHGNDESPDDNAIVLGHKVPLSYKEEYELLSLLCATALSLDNRFDDDPQEEVVIVYKRPIHSDKPVEEQQLSSRFQQSKPTPTPNREYHSKLQEGQTSVSVTKKDKQNPTTKPSTQPIVVEQKAVKDKGSVQVEKAKQTKVAERRINLVELHKQKMEDLKSCFDGKFKLLGITDEIVELYRQEKYRAIFVIFISSCRKYFIRQSVLDEEAFGILWNQAHNYVYELVNEKRRVPGGLSEPKKRHSRGSVIGYRKRSFSSHIANSGVWGRMAAYGGTNGRIIRINAGHGRR